ncbi:transposase [Aeromonas veronii]|uniref:transposase n=1 Tax=Aeromonas veronii TaxID=654 RepID=UPI00366D065A
MAKSKVQFQKGYTLFEFLKDYGAEAQCENALLAWRFPNGFVCPECANKTEVISDRLACFKAVKEANCEHLGVVTGGNLDWLDHPAFNWVNTMIGNVKNSLRGSCHTLGAKHLPRHLAEYCFRFNHRFDLKSMLVELGHAVVASAPMPYRLLKLAEGHG